MTQSNTVRGLNRRSALLALGAAGAGGVLAAGVHVPADAAPLDVERLAGDAEGYHTKLILLGCSGGPVQSAQRTMIASALAVGDRYYLVDLGSSAVRRASQAGIGFDAIGAIFVTHNHSDHLADLFPLFWLSQGRLVTPIPVYGPGSAGYLPVPAGNVPVPVVNPDRPTPGISDSFHAWLSAAAYDINIRANENGDPTDFTTRFHVTDVMPPDSAGASPDNTAPAMVPFPVFEDDRIRVTAILVPHGRVFPSFAYRFDTDDGSVTFSGDTAKSDNVARLAHNTDILVHEAVDLDYFAGSGLPPAALEHLRNAHTTPEDVGRVATAAGARSVVLTHLAPGDPSLVSDESWEQRVRTTYAGSVQAGHDLTQFGVGRRN